MKKMIIKELSFNPDLLRTSIAVANPLDPWIKKDRSIRDLEGSSN